MVQDHLVPLCGQIKKKRESYYLVDPGAKQGVFYILLCCRTLYVCNTISERLDQFFIFGGEGAGRDLREF